MKISKPKTGEVWKHFKGNEIRIIAVGKNTETLDDQVVYLHNNDIWVRPMEMFMSKVDKNKYPDVEQEYRFVKIN